MISERPRKSLLLLLFQIYTVNTKQSIREAYFRRLKSHVPNVSAKDNPTKLEVILEAISYIQRLKKDLENGGNNNFDESFVTSPFKKAASSTPTTSSTTAAAATTNEI